ncbi:rCG30954 [Rattus norvegicus]|uniref:RCG30954 n=1 Tax=Rattus norvegicus TaxID=10116 RepID=A6ISL2_RAT|nr:rCG30954 [Rattus norvegicus]
MLLWRSEPGSSARSLNSCLVDRTSLLASSTTSNSSGSASSGAHTSHLPPGLQVSCLLWSSLCRWWEEVKSIQKHLQARSVWMLWDSDIVLE